MGSQRAKHIGRNLARAILSTAERNGKHADRSSRQLSLKGMFSDNRNVNPSRKVTFLDDADKTFARVEYARYGDRDVMLKDHAATTDLYKTLVDIRFKLLTFVPTITTIAVGILSRNNPQGLVDRGTTLLVGVAGLVASMAIVMYEIRNSQIHDRAVHRIKHLERLLGFSPSYKGRDPRGMFEERGKGGKLFGIITVKHDRALSLIYGIVLALWTWLILRGLGDLVGWAGTQTTGRDAVIRATVAALMGITIAVEITRQGGLGRSPQLIYTLKEVASEVGWTKVSDSRTSEGEKIWKALKGTQEYAKTPSTMHDIMRQSAFINIIDGKSACAPNLAALALASGMIVDHQRRWPPWDPRKGREYALKVEAVTVQSPGESLAQAIVGGQEIYTLLCNRHRLSVDETCVSKDLIVHAQRILMQRFGVDAPWCSYEEVRLRFEILTIALKDTQKIEENEGRSIKIDERIADD